MTFETLAGRHDITSLQEAAQLCRGELMEGLSPEGCPEFELWLVAERERWNQRVIWVLDTLVAYHIRRGEYPRGLDDVGKLLALAPWWEKAHRQKMLLLARTGQCSAALRQYETCRRILVEDLGVEPTAETTALYERIRAARERPPHCLPPQPTPFVGREDEWGIAALLNKLNGATYHLGEYEEAERLLEQGLAICAKIGDWQGTAYTLDNLGVVAETLAEFIEAKRRYQEALATLVSQLAPVAVAVAVERAKARTLEEVG